MKYKTKEVVDLAYRKKAKSILTELGYEKSGVFYNTEILQDITDFLTSNQILINELNHRGRGYKMVGTLYKYYWLDKYTPESVVLPKTPNISDGEHYSNLFWSYYDEDDSKGAEDDYKSIQKWNKDWTI